VNCPFDATPLQVVNRSGVEIDWCPSCKGVWLERGELDKLIDLATNVAMPAAAPAPAMPAPSGAPAPAPQEPQPRGGDARYTERRRDWDDDDDDWDDRRRQGDDGYRSKKRKNLLSEIFDF
jgi:uncharacterized protein